MAIAPPANMPNQEVEAPDHSLLSEARRPEGSAVPDRWESGFSIQPESCAGAAAWDPCSTGTSRDKSDPAPTPDEIEYQPFVVEAPVRCSSFGWQAADYQSRAERLLAAAESRAIEREFWTGEKVPGNLSLQGGTPNDDDHILNPGGFVAPQPVSPQMALVLLSSALSNCGSGAKGMIHATPGMVEIWTHNGHLDVDGDVLRTGSRGDIVIAGSGYTGQGPYGQLDPAAGQVWVYATGLVSVLLGDAEVYPRDISEAFDRATNTVEFRGERTAAVYHDGCCSFAVLVDLTAGPVPQEQCDGVEPTARSYEIRTAFFESDFGGLLPSLFIGIVGGVTPAPESMTGQLNYAEPRGPIDGAPTFADLPSTWMDSGAPPNPDPAVVIPLVYGAILPSPGWLRLVVTDENGCFTSAYAYFPDGIPPTWDNGITYWLAVSDLDFVEITLPPGATPADGPEDFPLALDVVDEMGVCPVQPFAVPVTQACDEVWNVAGEFDVEVDLGVDPVDCDGTASLPVAIQCVPEGGLEVSGPDSGPVVSVLQRQSPEVVKQFVNLNSSDPASATAVAPGFVRLVVKGYGSATTSIRFFIDEIEYILWSSTLIPGLFESVTIDAPEGMVFNDPDARVVITPAGDEIDGAGASIVAYYPA